MSVVGGAAIRVHVPAVLPYLFFLTCPLMHLFMHGGHGSHDQHGDTSRQESAGGTGREDR